MGQPRRRSLGPLGEWRFVRARSHLCVSSRESREKKSDRRRNEAELTCGRRRKARPKAKGQEMNVSLKRVQVWGELGRNIYTHAVPVFARACACTMFPHCSEDFQPSTSLPPMATVATVRCAMAMAPRRPNDSEKSKIFAGPIHFGR